MSTSTSRAVSLAIVILAALAVVGLTAVIVHGGAILTVDTDDGLLDTSWPAAPDVADPLGDTTFQDWTDITAAWFGFDAPAPATYFFRIQVGTGPVGDGGTAHVELDCDGDGSFAGEAIDKKIHYWVGYDHPDDGLAAVWVTTPSGIHIVSYSDEYGEVLGTDYELRADASDLGLCATPPFGLRFLTNHGADVTGPVSTPPFITVEPAAGGTLVYTGTHGLTTTIEVPPDAVTDTTTILFTAVSTPTAPSGFGFAGHAFDLEAYRDNTPLATLTFSPPVTITIHYTDTAVLGVDEGQLLLLTWNAAVSQWEDAACGAYDRHPLENWLSVPICHLSRFALFGRQYELYLPLALCNAP